MKIAATAVAAVALFVTATADAGFASSGTASYHWEFSSATASVGDTVDVTLVAEYTPGTMPFFALGDAAFDVVIGDLAGGGTIDNRAIHSSFAALGNLGILSGTDIVGVTATQFPAIDPSTVLDLFTFQYTVDAAAPRIVTFDLANETNMVFTGPSIFDPVVTYDSTSTAGQLEITAVPAPGALALLSLAGLVSRRGRRRTTSA